MMRLLLTVAAIALLASSCGSAENDPNLAASAAKTEDAGTSRFAASGVEAGGNERIELTCSGEADYSSKLLRLSCDYGSQGAWDFVGVGNDLYMRGRGFGIGTVAPGQWLRTTDDDESLADELSPQRLLAMLRGASRETERVGEEEVRGVDTVRYRLVVDCEQVELTDCEGATTTVGVWIDEDGLVRRIAVDETEAPFTFDFFDFGAEVEIEAPPAGEVVDFDEWYAPKPCQPSQGVPITGRDVSAALTSHALIVDEDRECYGDLVDVVSFEGSAEPPGFGSCDVSAPVRAGSQTFEFSGMQTAEVGNVRCSYGEELASEMDAVVAELERQIRK